MRTLTLAVLATLASTACAGARTPDLDLAPPPAASAEEAQGGGQSSPGGKVDAAALQAAANGAWRSEQSKARNVFRHPVETLSFFGIRPGDTVVEITPGGGWYTEVIAPYLSKGGGTYVAALGDPAANERAARGVAAFKERFADQAVFGTVKVSVFALDGRPACEPGSADVVVTFRNVHNWMSAGRHDAAYKAFFDCLKPGGVLGLIEHRREEGPKPQDPAGGDGYIKESYVIAAAEKAGFKLAGKSEINANPKDTKDHPFGVWTLPPVRSTGNPPNPNFDRAKYDAIGESDRMTLKFVKPS
jgi:predicted methyltransferase